MGQTENIEAYNWFIRGRALWDWSDFLNVNLAISYFEKAVEADPDYAMAWGYLAITQLTTFLWRPFEVASAAAIPAYEKALALDPGQSEALATKALLIQVRDHDWETAGKLYQKAIESAGSSNAMLLYGIFYLQHIGRIEKAIQLYVEAEKRDPLHAGYKSDLSALYVWNGDAETGIRKAREALELNPQHQLALLALIDAYFATGNFTGLQQILEDIPLAMQEHSMVRARVALSYLSQGDYAKSREVYQELIGRELALLYQGLPITALLAIRLGEVEKGIDLMETAVDLNMWNQFFIASQGRNIEAIKDHPRYLALLQRMRLDDESLAELHRRMSFD